MILNIVWDGVAAKRMSNEQVAVHHLTTTLFHKKCISQPCYHLFISLPRLALRLTYLLFYHSTFEVLNNALPIVVAYRKKLISIAFLPVVNIFYENQNLRPRWVLAVRLVGCHDLLAYHIPFLLTIVNSSLQKYPHFGTS
jgi:hypothetical protein